MPKFVLTAAEAEAVLEQPDTREPIGIRDRAILETLYSTGIRRMDESLVGWHRNPPPWDANLIVFATTGFYVCDPEGNQRVLASDIVDYRRPESKEAIDGVTVITKHGPIFVRIAGTFGPNGQQKDAYSFIMVLRELLAVNRPDWTAPDDSS